MPRLQEMGKAFYVAIPKTKVMMRGWKKGQLLDWSEYPNGDLVLKEVPK